MRLICLISAALTLTDTVSAYPQKTAADGVAEHRRMLDLDPPPDAGTEGGKHIGDWRVGEKPAQNGRGMTSTDSSAAPLPMLRKPQLGTDHVGPAHPAL